MARPSEYNPVIIPAVKAAAHFGATRAEIADYLGISKPCFAQWCSEHEELNVALKLGTEASDRRVVDSLYQQAIAGNPTCIIFWLKNRRPSEWRDVQNIEANHAHYIVSDHPMTEEEWIEARADRAQVIDTKALPQSTDDTAKPLE